MNVRKASWECWKGFFPMRSTKKVWMDSFLKVNDLIWGRGSVESPLTACDLMRFDITLRAQFRNQSSTVVADKKWVNTVIFRPHHFACRQKASFESNMNPQLRNWFVHCWPPLFLPCFAWPTPVWSSTAIANHKDENKLKSKAQKFFSPFFRKWKKVWEDTVWRSTQQKRRLKYVCVCVWDKWAKAEQEHVDNQVGGWLVPHTNSFEASWSIERGDIIWKQLGKAIESNLVCAFLHWGD